MGNVIVEVLARQERGSRGLNWFHEQDQFFEPVAWRVRESDTGVELAVYDCPEAAHEAANGINTIRREVRA